MITTLQISGAKRQPAAEKISLLNPHVCAKPFPVRLTKDNAGELLSGYDIAVDCCDNFATRYVLSDATIICRYTYGLRSRFSVYGSGLRLQP